MTSGGTARKETVCFDSGTSDGCHAGMIEVASSEPPGPDGAPLLAESAVPCGQAMMVWATGSGAGADAATSAGSGNSGSGSGAAGVGSGAGSAAGNTGSVAIATG